MKEIKTRKAVKDIRTLDRAANVADRMKRAYVRTKEQAEQTQRTNADSPTGYAEDRTTESAQNATRVTGSFLHRQDKRLAEKTRHKIRERFAQENPSAHGQKSPHNAAASETPHLSEESIARGRNFAQKSTLRRKEQISVSRTGEKAGKSVKTATRGLKQSARATEQAVKTSGRGSIKTQSAASKLLSRHRALPLRRSRRRLRPPRNPHKQRPKLHRKRRRRRERQQRQRRQRQKQSQRLSSMQLKRLPLLLRNLWRPLPPADGWRW